MTVRVLLVDDHDVVRTGLKMYFSLDSDLEVVGEARNGQEAVEQVGALTPDEWTRQTVYQVLTDRFARTDGSTSAPCGARDYCGGTWRGLIDHFDYIQGMGFSAVSTYAPPLVRA